MSIVKKLYRASLRLVGGNPRKNEHQFNRDFHNSNSYFYTLSPAAIRAISYSFNLLARSKPELLAKGGYYEFGIFKGFILWYAEIAFRHLTGQNFKYYGFDSFEGLPAGSIDEHEWWLPGNYGASIDQVRSNLEAHGADLSRMHLCKGWFSKELFSNFVKEQNPNRIAIVNIDSDMYESCKEVLQFFGPSFEIGTIILFDELRNAFQIEPEKHGELRAVTEYLAGRPSLKIKHLLDYGQFGAAYQVTNI
jgi:hypothetical protein